MMKREPKAIKKVGEKTGSRGLSWLIYVRAKKKIGIHDEVN
jgi:hypothetical protein